MKYLNLSIVQKRQIHDRDARSNLTSEAVTVSSGSWTKLIQCMWTKPILFYYCNANKPKENAKYSKSGKLIALKTTLE